MNYVDPEEAGVDANRLALLRETIARDIDAALYDGCVTIVARRSGVVFHEAYGFADRDSGRPMQKGTLFHSMSSGKQFASALALNRVECGRLRLNMQVRELIPEFGCKGKETVTLLHLLTHTGGILTDIVPGLTDETLGDLELTVQGICDSEAVGVPGREINYSAYAGSAIVAEMLRRVDPDRRSWRQLVLEDLFQPLGMRETAAGLPAERRGRVCPIRARSRFIREEVQRLDQFIDERTEIPGGTYTLTAEDLYRFAALLLNDGELDGFRLLSPATLDLACLDHTGSTPERVAADQAAGKWPLVYGLGFIIRGPGMPATPFGTLASPTTFGGMGHGSTMFWVDRQRDLCMVFLSTGLIDDARHVLRCQRYSDIVHGAVRR